MVACNRDLLEGMLGRRPAATSGDDNLRTAELVFDPINPGFSTGFMSPASLDALYRKTYLDVHTRWLDALPTTEELLQ